MAMEVNGTAILAAIAENPGSFGMNGPQINALAMATLVARFKDKAVGVAQMRSIARSIGAADFRLALDHVSGKDVIALTKRLDPRHPDLKTASEPWFRQHLWALAEGGVEPMAEAAKPAKKTPPQKEAGPKTGAVMKSQALKPAIPPKTPKSRAPRKKT